MIQLPHELENAIRDGNLTFVRNYVKTKIYDDNKTQDILLRKACFLGKINIVRYMLTSPEVKTYGTINKSPFLRLACYHHHQDVMDYLLNSKELKEHSIIQEDDYEWACDNEKWDIAVYLLRANDTISFDIDKSKYNLNWAIKENQHEIVHYILVDLQKRDFIRYIEEISKLKQQHPEVYAAINLLNKNSAQEETNLYI